MRDFEMDFKALSCQTLPCDFEDHLNVNEANVIGHRLLSASSSFIQ